MYSYEIEHRNNRNHKVNDMTYVSESGNCHGKCLRCGEELSFYIGSYNRSIGIKAVIPGNEYKYRDMHGMHDKEIKPCSEPAKGQKVYFLECDGCYVGDGIVDAISTNGLGIKTYTLIVIDNTLRRRENIFSLEDIFQDREDAESVAYQNLISKPYVKKM